MNIHNSYFSITNPLRVIDRWLHPFRHRTLINLRKHDLCIEWTQRAEQALQNRTAPLITEMQLYFTCVIKKRVLFHEQFDSDSLPVNDKLAVAFRTVESTSCDPVEFAANFPVKRELQSPAANKIHPVKLQLDFQNNDWLGEFYI